MTAKRGTQKPSNIGKPNTGTPSKPNTHERPTPVGSPHTPKGNVSIPKSKGK